MNRAWLIRFNKLGTLLVLFVSFNLSAGPRAVATFESIGIYWGDAEAAGVENECKLEYRVLGTQDWSHGQSLWYDDRGGDYGDPEYRGSLVNLTSNTEYEIKLSLESGESSTTVVTTWSDEFPIAKTIEMPITSSDTLEITESGTPDGYILYTAPAGKTSTLNAKGVLDHNITINASYIIIKGLVLKNASMHAIRLYENAHDVVIDSNKISRWGRVDEDGWGVNADSAIFSNKATVEKIIIQNNNIFEPNADTNNWLEYRESLKTYHPNGPQAITFSETAGNHVIRYNNIYSGPNRYFNDCIGGGVNYSFSGSPNKDSDIYGNYISNCWDDAIESEGANKNVRIWGNYINKAYNAIATASTSIGPLYIWRNLYGISQKSDLDDWDETDRGGFLKTGQEDMYTGGKIFVFHNTILQPKIGSATESLGARTGLGMGGKMKNVVSRNNILNVIDSNDPSIRGDINDDGDYDYDLYNGRIDGDTSNQKNGLYDMPIYTADFSEEDVFEQGIGEFSLDTKSSGHDGGVILPNFNDEYVGTGPDIGAHENGNSSMIFGPQDIITTSKASDHFEYGNENGGQGWSTSWSLKRDALVQKGGLDVGYYELELLDYDSQAIRTLDLNGASSATLSFYWMSNIQEGFGFNRVEIYDGSWHTIWKTTKQQMGNEFELAEVDLSNYSLNSEFKIKFTSRMTDSNTSYFKIDGVKIVFESE
ncbi:MAG: hypothetical protein ABJH28_01320 [Paraglaciecola sp.]|uniref:hypothetical protein n=2 Tax=Paraglaciecola sp. TaxID=1920173 RepID=UPI00326625BF